MPSLVGSEMCIRDSPSPLVYFKTNPVDQHDQRTIVCLQHKTYSPTSEFGNSSPAEDSLRLRSPSAATRCSASRMCAQIIKHTCSCLSAKSRSQPPRFRSALSFFKFIRSPKNTIDWHREAQIFFFRNTDHSLQGIPQHTPNLAPCQVSFSTSTISVSFGAAIH